MPATRTPTYDLNSILTAYDNLLIPKGYCLFQRYDWFTVSIGAMFVEVFALEIDMRLEITSSGPWRPNVMLAQKQTHRRAILYPGGNIAR